MQNCCKPLSHQDRLTPLSESGPFTPLSPRFFRSACFKAAAIEETAIRGSIESLAEHAGLQMRNEKRGALTVRLALAYSDGVEAQGSKKTKRLLVTDRELAAAAYAVYQKIMTRRIRIRSVSISLEDTEPLGYQPVLFEAETDIKNRRAQEAADRVQNRYGAGKLCKGAALLKGAACAY